MAFATVPSSAIAPRSKLCGANARNIRTAAATRPPPPATLLPDEELSKVKPDWAGEDATSQMVNVLINSPIYELLKPLARRTIFRTAEKNGVPWRQVASSYDIPQVKDRLDQIRNPDVEYPSYYLQKFHAYDAGNLDWQPAFEAEPATYAMSRRVYKNEEVSAEETHRRLRDSYTDCIASYLDRHPEAVQQGDLKRILDIGCSVGCSTRAVADRWPQAQVVGLDLSPYMLAVAEHAEEMAFQGEFREAGVGEARVPERKRIEYTHRLAEKSGYPDGAFDAVSIAFVFHECPEHAIRDILTEAVRIVRPGGVVFFTDNDPRSPVIQSLPPAIFTLMKSTEPWSDQYYTTDIKAIMSELGLVDVEYHRTDPRHRTVLGRKPSA